MYLFVLAVETLAIAVCENSSIKGIKLGENGTKLLQYADDTTAVLSDTNSALALSQLLHSFHDLSVLKVNNNKTEGLWIGSLKDNQMKPFDIKWPNELIQGLGVFFYI